MTHLQRKVSAEAQIQHQRQTGEKLAGEALTLTIYTDQGYFSGKQIRACKQAGTMALLPQPETSGAKQVELPSLPRGQRLSNARPANAPAHRLTRIIKKSAITPVLVLGVPAPIPQDPLHAVPVSRHHPLGT